MKFKVLGCYGSSEAGFNLTSFLINDKILLDAGDGVSSLTYEEQIQIKKIILSHAHLDHICSLPFLALNLFDSGNYPTDVITPIPVIRTVKSHIMNDEVWPDFSRIPTLNNPVFRYIEITENEEMNLGEITITPINGDHIVPCYGYLLKEKNNAILFSGDTCDATSIFKIADKIDNLKAIIVEVTFSSDNQKLADDSKHLTPFTLGKQLENLKSPADIYLFHMKSNQLEKIIEECKKIHRKLFLLQQGKTYNFGT
jgi:ribonuclease BN (tRNA processing enzyme)